MRDHVSGSGIRAVIIHGRWMQNEGHDEKERKSWDTTRERESRRKVKLKFFAGPQGRVAAGTREALSSLQAWPLLSLSLNTLVHLKLYPQTLKIDAYISQSLNC